MIVGYGRVSRQQQANQPSLRDQSVRLLLSGCDRVFVDIESRAKDGRTGLDQIIQLIENGAAKEIRVVRYDRLMASLGLYERLLKLCQDKGVKLTSLDEPFTDPTTIAGQLLLGVQVLLSKSEVNTTQMRIAQSYKNIRNNGRANVQTPFGIRRNSKGFYELDKKKFICTIGDEKVWSKSAISSWIFKNYEETRYSVTQTLRRLNDYFGLTTDVVLSREKFKNNYIFETVEEAANFKPKQTRVKKPLFFSRDGLRKWLANPVLAGATAYGVRGTKKQLYPLDNADTLILGTHEGIIPWDKYLEIYDTLKYQRSKYGNTQGTPKYLKPLSGLLVCDRCRRTMRTQTNKKSNGHIFLSQCRNYQQGRTCLNRKMVVHQNLIDSVALALSQKAEQIAAKTLLVDNPVPQIEELITQKKNQIEGLRALGDNPAFIVAIREIEEQIERLKTQASLSVLKNDSETLTLLAGFRDINYWKSLSDENLRYILHSLIAEIRIDGGAIVSITWNF